MHPRKDTLRIMRNMHITQQMQFYLFARHDTVATACFVAAFVE